MGSQRPPPAVSSVTMNRNFSAATYISVRCCSHTAFLHQMQQELADLHLTELLGRSSVVRDEVPSAEQVVLPRGACKTLELKICFHPFTNSAHDDPPRRRPNVAADERIPPIATLQSNHAFTIGRRPPPAAAQRLSSRRIIRSPSLSGVHARRARQTASAQVIATAGR